jgi:hypothetical protein
MLSGAEGPYRALTKSLPFAGPGKRQDTPRMTTAVAVAMAAPDVGELMG